MVRKYKSEIKEKRENNQKDIELARHKIELSQTNRGNKQIILDKKYKYNYQYKKKMIQPFIDVLNIKQKINVFL